MQIKKYLIANKTLQLKLKRLSEEGARTDRFVIDTDLDTSMNAHKDMPTIFSYEDGESLIALLSVFAPGSDEIEVNALVHPAFRNKGLFRSLLREAADTALGFGYQKGLFVCKRASVSGQGVIRHWGCELGHAELQMVCEAPADSDYKDIEIIEAKESDVEELSRLGAAAFDRDIESEEEMIRNSIASEDRTQYIAKYGGRMAGLCAAAECDGKVMIFGLGVHPDERRKGYARALLSYVAARAREIGINVLCLDVDKDNPGAIALYESFGFITTGCTEYYDFSLEAFK